MTYDGETKDKVAAGLVSITLRQFTEFVRENDKGLWKIMQSQLNCGGFKIPILGLRNVQKFKGLGEDVLWCVKNKYILSKIPQCIEKHIQT